MLGKHDRAMLEFSGGKDSLAALYLARPYLDRITVLFADTGGTFPHVVEFVKDTCSDLGATLQIVEPQMPAPQFTELYGLPSDMVPAWATAEMAWTLKDRPKRLLQAPMTCCMTMLLLPLSRTVIASGVKLVIRGAKKADKRVGVPPGTLDQYGIEYQSPIWEWTDDDVFAYLKAEGATLADHYNSGVNDSLDCWMCTGHMPYGDAGRKLDYTKKNYPELWPEVQRRLRAVHDTVKAEQARIDSVTARYLEDSDA